MKTYPASKLHPCPLELNGAHQGQYIHYNNSSLYKLVDGKDKGWGALCRFGPCGDRDVIATYVGGLHDHDAQGHGQLHVDAEKFSYIGGWRDNVAAGWGKWCDSSTEAWPDGAMRYKELTTPEPKNLSYEGGFKDGYFHGYGELSWVDGSNYKGSWKEGRRDGCGIYTNKEGTEQYYWTFTLPDHCGSDDDESGDYKKEHKRRLAAVKKLNDAAKKLKEEEEKEKKEETRRKEEHKKRVEVEGKLEKKQEELEKEIEKWGSEHTAKEVAEAKLNMIETEHSHDHHFHLF